MNMELEIDAFSFAYEPQFIEDLAADAGVPIRTRASLCFACLRCAGSQTWLHAFLDKMGKMMSEDYDWSGDRGHFGSADHRHLKAHRLSHDCGRHRGIAFSHRALSSRCVRWENRIRPLKGPVAVALTRAMNP